MSLVIPEIEACIHCGLCLSACPTYRVTQLEAESPRASQRDTVREGAGSGRGAVASVRPRGQQRRARVAVQPERTVVAYCT